MGGVRKQEIGADLAEAEEVDDDEDMVDSNDSESEGTRMKKAALEQAEAGGGPLGITGWRFNKGPSKCCLCNAPIAIAAFCYERRPKRKGLRVVY